MAKNVQLKLDDALAEEFQALQQELGTAQEFATALMEAYRATREDASDVSPVTREGRRLDTYLAKVKEIAMAYMTIAEVEKEAALASLEEKLAKAEDNVAVLADNLKASLENYNRVAKDYTKQTETINTLKAQAESTQALKEAWHSERQGFLERIAALDAEAQGARAAERERTTLAGYVQEREKTIADLQGKMAVLTLQETHATAALENTERALAELKAENKELRSQTATALADTRKAHGDYVFVSRELNDANQTLGKARAAFQEKEATLAKRIIALEGQLKAYAGEEGQAENQED